MANCKKLYHQSKKTAGQVVKHKKNEKTKQLRLNKKSE